MKKTANMTLPNQDDMKPEYALDYQNARTNRFAGQSEDRRTVVVLDPELSAVFQTPDAVNNVLRALVKTMPSPSAVIKSHNKARTRTAG